MIIDCHGHYNTMADSLRLNGAIRALEQGQPAFVTFCAPEIGAAQNMAAAPYDGVVFEMEHNPFPGPPRTLA
ncbi:MAG: hypothetical protein HYY78_21245 [Betaproteobacteria bacterium]|nr:hypothetical protein [Betaproteobacteria bacterium]